MRKFEHVSLKYRTNDNLPKLPQRATKHSAAYDFYSPCDVLVPAHGNILIFTDVKAAMESDEVLLINVRSSMGNKGIALANTQGWIDSDYYSNESNDGNIGIKLVNHSDVHFLVHEGERLAQGMFVKYLITDDDTTDTERKGGMGSTGK